MEIWKDVKDYEGIYKVSSFGRVKSLERKAWNGFGIHTIKERFLKGSIGGNGYLMVSLCKNGIPKKIAIHTVVSVAFLNHIPNGFKLVVNHKDFNKSNNHIDNLEIVTMRENTNQKHIPHSSKYTGVYFDKKRSKWRAHIQINGINKKIGYFVNEYDAHLAYETAKNAIF